MIPRRESRRTRRIKHWLSIIGQTIGIVLVLAWIAFAIYGLTNLFERINKALPK